MELVSTYKVSGVSFRRQMTEDRYQRSENREQKNTEVNDYLTSPGHI
jgi:hypothetical protein